MKLVKVVLYLRIMIKSGSDVITKLAVDTFSVILIESMFPSSVLVSIATDIMDLIPTQKY